MFCNLKSIVIFFFFSGDSQQLSIVFEDDQGMTISYKHILLIFLGLFTIIQEFDLRESLLLVFSALFEVLMGCLPVWTQLRTNSNLLGVTQGTAFVIT